MKAGFASTVLMIRPENFGYNPESAATNPFQSPSIFTQKEIQEKALREFDAFVTLLVKFKINVELIKDNPAEACPDAIYPNNWFTTHPEGTIYLYPMLNLNRRKERRKDIIDLLCNKYEFKQTVDLTSYETENKIVEGTGSLILDRKNKIGYANVSSRTNKELAEEICKKMGYQSYIFDAVDSNGMEIYHTNVLMSICDGFAIVCLAAIIDRSERETVTSMLASSGLKIVDISLKQLNSFCANALQLKNSEGENILVMSERAYSAYEKSQLEIMQEFTNIIYSPLETIENTGGGSARCMMAEIFPIKAC